MPRTIRFHLDEHCPHAIAQGLRRAGVDVTTITEAGLLRAPDERHIAFARLANRVIFTQDDDFLVLHARGVPHGGILYCRQGSRDVGWIVDALTLIWEVYEPEEMVGKIEYI